MLSMFASTSNMQNFWLKVWEWEYNNSHIEFVLRCSRGKGQEVIQTDVSLRDDLQNNIWQQQFIKALKWQVSNEQ